MVKWQSWYLPSLGPQKVLSKVKLFIRLNSFHITTLAEVSHAFCTTKLQFWKLKFSEFFENRSGKILSFSLSAF